tara:strand:- start:24 stop:497 length:474 start_codon:yes stop_codon:yes gene_type:complete
VVFNLPLLPGDLFLEGGRGLALVGVLERELLLEVLEKGIDGDFLEVFLDIELGREAIGVLDIVCGLNNICLDVEPARGEWNLLLGVLMIGSGNLDIPLLLLALATISFLFELVRGVLDGVFLFLGSELGLLVFGVLGVIPDPLLLVLRYLFLNTIIL